MLATRMRMAASNRGDIEYVLATDDDFSGTSNGSFKYIGTDEYVEIPHVIKGVPVNSYSYMFENSNVKGVVTNNHNVTNMGYMFNLSKATSLDLSNFDTSSVTIMNSMFRSSGATSLDLSSFDTSKVTSTHSMFYGSYATSLDLSSFDTSKVTNMSSMFRSSQTTTLDLSSFDTSRAAIVSSMFRDSQTTIGYARTQADADKLNGSSNKPAALNFIVKPNIYKLATDDDFSGEADGSFSYIGTDNYVEIPHVIKGINVTSYVNMFYGTSVKGVASTNKNVTDMSFMFYDSQATNLDISSLDTSNVTNMTGMFFNSQATNLDVSNFDTSNVTDMIGMFYQSQATSLDLSSFDTNSVTNMSGMFRFSQATSLDLSSFNTNSVTNMDSMFRESQVTSLDLSSFDTSEVMNIDSMFEDSQATIGYARTQADANRFNASSGKPAVLNFIVKP